MNWSRDTDFEVVLTRQAEMQAQRILDYIFYELENAQAAYSVEKDMRLDNSFDRGQDQN